MGLGLEEGFLEAGAAAVGADGAAGRGGEADSDTAKLLPRGGGGGGGVDSDSSALDADDGDSLADEDYGDGPTASAATTAGQPAIDPHAPPTWGEYARLVATIVKSFIGSGVLFLPSAFKNGGWAFSVASMTLAAVLTQVCIMRLIACRSVVTGSYGTVGRKAVGRWGEVAVDVSLVLSQSGFCIVYVTFIAKNVLQLMNAHSCWLGGSYLWAFIVAQFAVFWPLTLVRRISWFGKTNLAADAIIAVGLTGILAYCISGMVGKAHDGVALVAPAFNSGEWPLMLGTAVYAFEGIGMVVPVYDSLRPGLAARFPALLSATLFAVAGVYVIVGLIPYLYLDGMAHAAMADAVTLNLPRVWWAFAIQGSYCVALALSYPLMLFPAVRIIEKALTRARLMGRDADGFVARRNAVRAAIVAGTLGVALAGGDTLVSFIGCFCCTPLAFIYPTLFHYRLVKDTGRLVRWSNLAIMGLGIGIFVFSTYEAIAQWAITPLNPCLTSR